MKILKVSFVILSLLSSAMAFAGNDGDLAKRVFMLGNFSSVSVSSGIDLYLEPSSKTEAVLVAEKRVIDNVEVTLQGKELVIKMKSGLHFNFSRKAIKVYLSYKQINDIKASGGSDVYMNNGATLSAKSLNLEGSGGSDFKLKINVENLNTEFSGGSDLYLNGSAGNASISSSGGSDIKLKDLTIKNCNLEVSGASDAEIKVLEKLVVNASGASDVYYYGNPKQKDISASGGSDVKGR